MIRRYVLVDADNAEAEDEYDEFTTAKDAAERLTAAGQPTAVLERTYEYSDSELVWTPDGLRGLTWPPDNDRHSVKA